MNKKVIIIAAAGLLAIGGGGAAALKFGILGGSGAVTTASPAAPKVAYVEVREMTLRLADASSEHYIKIDPVVAVRAKEEQAVVDKIPVVRDRIVTVVTARSSDELSSPAGERKLKEDLVAALHKDFQDTLIDIYFSDYLVE
jgi:flagellar protein FliL